MSASVDWDRLAEYAAGLLDGTPDAEQVAHLIEANGAWARAYEELCAADGLVVADLAALASIPEPMPADVVARLEGVIAAEERAGAGTVVSLDARRRRRRWTAVGAIAAGVAALALFGPPILRSTTGSELQATDSGSAARAPALATVEPGEGGLIVSASGTNYHPDALFGAATTVRGGVEDKSGVNSAAGEAEKTALPAELVRLSTARTRQDCFAVLVKRYGGHAVSVDYARFDDKPALLVVLADSNNRPTTIVAAGPDCGLNGEADVLHSAPA